MKISNRKQKGSLFEYSVRDSLAQNYPDVLLTKQEGFAKQYDIFIPSAKIAIECKRHKSFSWNELEKYFVKLQRRIKENVLDSDNSVYTSYLIFQGNHQPPLVMFKSFGMGLKKEFIGVMPFESYFEIPFLRHRGKNKTKLGDKNSI